MLSAPRSLAKGQLWLLGALMIAAQVACNHSDTQQEVAASLELTSSSFADGVIPSKCACGGQDISPALSWSSPPPHTQSLALIVTDRDSRFGPLFGYFMHWVLGFFVHWSLYDLPADKRELTEGIARQEQLPDGSRQGQNDFDKIGYGGPCPPGNASHRYLFALYALDSRLTLPAGATENQLRKAMSGHILAKGELIGRYSR